jgi:exodeoxyribonuclease-3
MFRVVTANLNGIRSASSKGFFDWLKGQDADAVCVQEVKAQEQDLLEHMRTPHGMTARYHFAQKKGYSGVGVYTKLPPRKWVIGLKSPEFDAEGRYVQADFANVSVISVYLPSGSSGPERQAAKYRFLEEFLPHLQKLKRAKRETILCGDWNIAHQQIDLKNWRSNQKNSGFLPEERAWLTRVLDELGYVDVFRKLDQRPEQYTWWSNRGQAWAKNVGWRLDYQLATPKVAATARAAAIWKDTRFSDHAPLTIDYDFVP